MHAHNHHLVPCNCLSCSLLTPRKAHDKDHAERGWCIKKNALSRIVVSMLQGSKQPEVGHWWPCSHRGGHLSGVPRHTWCRQSAHRQESAYGACLMPLSLAEKLRDLHCHHKRRVVHCLGSHLSAPWNAMPLRLPFLSSMIGEMFGQTRPSMVISYAHATSATENR